MYSTSCLPSKNKIRVDNIYSKPPQESTHLVAVNITFYTGITSGPGMLMGSFSDTKKWEGCQQMGREKGGEEKRKMRKMKQLKSGEKRQGK